jgi:hypothetical protein
MRLHELFEAALRAEPVPTTDPITRKPMTSFRILDGETEVGRIAGRFAKTPEEALERFQASQKPVAPAPAPTTREPAKPVQEPVRPVRAARSALLYHFTTPRGLEGILGSDRLLANTQHIIGGKLAQGVSLTRDPRFDFEEGKPFRIALDWTALKQRHRIIPVRAGETHDDHKADPASQYGNEAEEFVIGQVPHVSRYLRGLGVRAKDLPAGFDLDGFLKRIGFDEPIEMIRG